MPLTKQQCPGCGLKGMERRTDHSETIRHGNSSVTVEGLAGLFCPECGDGLLDEDSSRRYSEAGDALIQQHRVEGKHEVTPIRPKLGLTQKTTSEVPAADIFPDLTTNRPGVALRGMRSREGLTQAQLALKVDIPQRHISEMENGKRSDW